MSNCLSSIAGSIEGRSPHVLPPEELFQHNFLENRDLSSHPLISPKFERRRLKPFQTAKTTIGLTRGFTDSITRNKRPLCKFNFSEIGHYVISPFF